MPEIDLPPGEYREKGRRRIIRATRGQLAVVIALALWAAAVLVFYREIFPDGARLWGYVIGLGPFALLWLWYALRDP